MAIRFYSWEDEGVPVIPTDDASRRVIGNLRDILLACLVNGYGGKPAAGRTQERAQRCDYGECKAGGKLKC